MIRGLVKRNKCSHKYNVEYKDNVFFNSPYSYFYCLSGYKTIKKIGEGTFSEVVKTQSLKDGKFYACKTMKQTINRYVLCNKKVSFNNTLLCMDTCNWSHQLDNPFTLSILLDVSLSVFDLVL